MKALLWALPAYGVLLGLSTLTHQPPVSDFGAYADYVTTDIFLTSHLGASVFGAALAILGAVGLAFTLGFSRPALAGLTLTTVANVFLAATFGSAAFVQPGIGRAHQAGVAGMPALNDDTAYGSALVVTALSASFLLVVAAVVMGVALSRAALKPYGIAYASLMALFVAGIAVPVVQPFAGFAFAAATGLLAFSVARHDSFVGAVSGRSRAQSVPTRQA
ncbi:hypothetical protein [Paractinoplanes atraurantiacus]|uniref:DUF4386 family protein n=1 Tax=Paractinoplanes atraurantiacus TaxID=1036182 RepID=A0A285K9R1_9ACTN|nr:hypothetical protein [Actinoplanes atraurantiacus]SNY68963.1 hypothetical protein SAMN05421748_13474 [Actinoplanes atraurantiacus]